MFKIRLEIYHKGCWGSEIGVKFPDLEISSVDCRWVKGQVAHLVRALGNAEQFQKVFNYLKNRKDVISAEIVSKSKNELHVRTITKAKVKQGQFSNIFFQNHCFPVAPTRFEKKYEVWTLGTAKRANLTKIYNLIKNKHETRITYLKEEPIKAKLTEKQREVLMYAKHFGYFEWPRKKTVTEIAQLLKIPKTVFLSHLRKAENKIMKAYN